MKRFLIYLLVTICFINSAKSQYIYLPDKGFRDFLKLKYPACFNEDMMDTTCAAILNEKNLFILGTSFWTDTIFQNLEGIQYFKSLDSLVVRGFSVEKIPDLPLSVKHFNVQSCIDLIKIPGLPNTLKTLFLYETGAPLPQHLPDSLTYLLVESNGYTSLPVFPSSLTSLSCVGNSLTSLPSLPNSLTDLHIFDYELSSLPHLPGNLKNMTCVGINLRCLPKLPASLEKLAIDTGNIRCLPNTVNGLIVYSNFEFENNIVNLPVCLTDNNPHNCPIANPTTTYTFTGNGNWSNTANWIGGNIPSGNIINGEDIIIDPPADGECILDIPLTISGTSKLTVKERKRFNINGNLIIQ